jgi:hypothetical protein
VLIEQGLDQIRTLHVSGCVVFFGWPQNFLDTDLRFLDSHLCNLCFGIVSERLGNDPLDFTNENYLKPR